MRKSFIFLGILSLCLVSTAEAYVTNNSRENLVYSATVEGGAGYLSTSTSGGATEDIDDENFWLLEGAARANIPLSSNFAFQLDLDGMLGLNERNDDNGDDYLQNYYFMGAHFTWRDSDTGAIGILGSYGEANGGETEEAQTWLLGLEGQYYFNDFTLYGQVGYMESNDEGENSVITNAWWARVVGRYFFDENQRLEAELAAISGKERGGIAEGPRPDVDGWSWGVRYDRAIQDGPVSFYASYLGTHIDNDNDDGDGGSLTDHTFLVGIKLALGANHMRDDDRRGVTLDTPARAMGRWTGWSLAVVDSSSND